jgi:hypothetical protein
MRPQKEKGRSMPSAEELDDPDPADQGFDGDNDLPVDERGERQLPPRLTIIGTTTSSPRGWRGASQAPDEWHGDR